MRYDYTDFWSPCKKFSARKNENFLTSAINCRFWWGRGCGKSSNQLIYCYSNSMNLFILKIYLYPRLFSSLSLIFVPNVLCFFCYVCLCAFSSGKTAESNRVLLLLVLLLFLFIVVVVCAALCCCCRFQGK